MALCHLLSHYITTGDERLGRVCVEEEEPSVGEGCVPVHEWEDLHYVFPFSIYRHLNTVKESSR